MSNRNLSFFVRMALIAIVFAVAGCGKLGLWSNLPPEEIVRERAQAWADDLLAGDVESAWELTSPAYRQFASAGQYKGQVAGTGRWTSAVVDSVRCSEDVCEVGLKVDYHIKRFDMSNQRVLEQKWIQVDGDWWLYVPVK